MPRRWEAKEWRSAWGVAVSGRASAPAPTRSWVAPGRFVMGTPPEDLETLEAEYLSGAPRCTFQVDICDEEKAERVGSSWSLTFAASCDDPDFYGSIGKEDQTIATQRTVLVESAGSYHLSSSSPVLLARCGDCDQQFTPTLLLGDTDIELEEGLYTLEFTLTKDAVVTFALVSETVDP